MSKKTIVGDDGKKYTVKEKKPFYKKWWFIAIIAIIVIGSIGSSMGGNTDSSSSSAPANQTNQAEKPAEEKTYTQVDFNQMQDELEANALKAEQTYKGQNIEVTGKVTVIDSSGQYIAIAAVNDDVGLTTINCTLQNDDQRNVVAELTKGQTIVVKGQVKDVGEVLGYRIKVDEIVAQ